RVSPEDDGIVVKQLHRTADGSGRRAVAPPAVLQWMCRRIARVTNSTSSLWRDQNFERVRRHVL
ncbi:MAG TPA: hypothetical protein VGD49_01790, partial [Longimicrobiales bacterium]